MREGAKGAFPDEKNVLMSDGMYYVGKGTLIPAAFCGRATDFFDTIRNCLRRTQIKGGSWFVHDGSMDDVVLKLQKYLKEVHKKGGKIIFVGNGGSAAIASHMAVDWTKNGGLRSIALNDAPTLTCLANDFGYENVFAKQLEYYATKKDAVIIVSSSGKSENILQAGKAARDMGCNLVTLSGMNPNNELRRLGNLNFYVPASDYGLVEVSHLCILHSVVSV